LALDLVRLVASEPIAALRDERAGRSPQHASQEAWHPQRRGPWTGGRLVCFFGRIRRWRPARIVARGCRTRAILRRPGIVVERLEREGDRSERVNAAPPSLHEARTARSPASTLIWGTPTPCRSSRRTSFHLAITIVSSPIRPHRLGTRAVDQPGVGKPGSGRQSRRKQQGLPSSGKTRLIVRQCSSDPGVTWHACGPRWS
jgi:hypothetical protein